VEILREGRNKIVKRKMERNKEEMKGRRKIGRKEGRKIRGAGRKKRMEEEMSQNVEFNFTISVNSIKPVAFKWEDN
jgi:hypothetical protein